MIPYAPDNISRGAIIDFEEMCLLLCMADSIDCGDCLLQDTGDGECTRRKSVLEAELLKMMEEEVMIRNE